MATKKKAKPKTDRRKPGAAEFVYALMQDLKTHFGDVIHDPEGVDKLFTTFAAKNRLPIVVDAKLAKVKRIAGGEIDFRIPGRMAVAKTADIVAMDATHEILGLGGEQGNKALALVIKRVTDFRILDEQGRREELREANNRYNRKAEDLDTVEKIKEGNFAIV